MTNERLLTEKNNLRKNRKYLFYAYPIMENKKKNMFHWQCGFPGPADSIYSKAYFTIFLLFPETYPLHPPKATFKDFVYHPNVFDNGIVCLDILQHKWKPSINIQQVLVGIQQLLVNPNNSSPANGTASSLYKKDRKKYESKVQENISKHHSSYSFNNI